MENDLKAKRQQQAQHSKRLGREVCLMAGSCILFGCLLKEPESVLDWTEDKFECLHICRYTLSER